MRPATTKALQKALELLSGGFVTERNEGGFSKDVGGVGGEGRF